MAFTVFVQNSDNYSLKEYRIGKDVTKMCYSSEQMLSSTDSEYSLTLFCAYNFKNHLYIANYNNDTILLKDENELKEKFLYEKEKSLRNDIKVK